MQKMLKKKGRNCAENAKKGQKLCRNYINCAEIMQKKIQNQK